MTAVNAASVLLIGWLAHRFTDDDTAAVAAGFVFLLVLAVYIMPPVGTGAQFYTLFFGLVALAFAIHDPPAAAGATAAISAAVGSQGPALCSSWADWRPSAAGGGEWGQPCALTVGSRFEYGFLPANTSIDSLTLPVTHSSEQRARGAVSVVVVI